MNKRQQVFIERWEQALRVTRAIPRGRLNMETWGYRTGRKPDCKTVGCIGGFCSLDRWFRRRGFSSKWSREKEHPRQYLDLTADPNRFFGSRGYHAILTNPQYTGLLGRGSRAEIIRAIKREIKLLKAGHPPENLEPLVKATRCATQS